MKRPPASATSDTCPGSSTVPAPISAALAQCDASAERLSRAMGEFSGISIIEIPASISSLATGSTSDGVMPRRMAMISRLIAFLPPEGQARLLQFVSIAFANASRFQDVRPTKGNRQPSLRSVKMTDLLHGGRRRHGPNELQAAAGSVPTAWTMPGIPLVPRCSTTESCRAAFAR